MSRAKARPPLTAVYINFRLTCLQYITNSSLPLGFQKMSRSRELCKLTSKAQSHIYIFYATSPSNMVVQTTKWDSRLEQQKVPLPKIAWKRTSVDTRGERENRERVENSPHRTPPPVPAFEKARLPRLVWLGFWEIKQKTNKQIKRCDNFLSAFELI